jgi:hypothetical protein
LEESIATARHGLKRQSTPSPSEIKLLDVLYGEWGDIRYAIPRAKKNLTKQKMDAYRSNTTHSLSFEPMI